MGGRLSVLDECAYDHILGCYIFDPMVGAQQAAESKWGCTILLAFYPHCFLRQATIPYISADLRQTPAIFPGILYWLWTLLGRVWVGMVGAEEDQRILCNWGRGRMPHRIRHRFLDPDFQLDDPFDGGGLQEISH